MNTPLFLLRITGYFLFYALYALGIALIAYAAFNELFALINL